VGGEDHPIREQGGEDRPRFTDLTDQKPTPICKPQQEATAKPRVIESDHWTPALKGEKTPSKLFAPSLMRSDGLLCYRSPSGRRLARRRLV
jgi:hypothetical protein